MNDRDILNAIWKQIDKGKLDSTMYEDAFSCIRNIGAGGEIPIEENHLLMEKINLAVLRASEKDDFRFMESMYELFKRTLFYTAPYCLDDFARAIEYDRKPEKKFYAPRRHYLKPMIQGYQDILDGKLRLLTVSMPKRALPMARCPLLLTGRNSVSPWTMPSNNASNQLMTFIPYLRVCCLSCGK